MKKIIISILFIYIIVVIESGFMAHFFFPNLLILYTLFFNLLEDAEKVGGLIVATVCGLFFDIFSLYFIGFYTLIFLFSAFLVKLILKRYVRLPSIFTQA